MAERILATCSLVALIAVFTGCSSGIDRAMLDDITTMPDDSTLLNASGGSGQMHTGIAAGFRPRAWTSDVWGTHEADSASIGVQSSNDAVVHVARVTSDARYVVWAAAPGQATLSVILNGKVAMRLPVTVSDPP